MRPTLQRTTVLGGIAWIGYVCLVVPDILHGAWAYALLLLAVLVLVPLALDLIDEAESGPGPEWWTRVARIIHFPAALLLTWSCSQYPGPWPAVAAIPWFLVCSLAASRGCWRILERGGRQTIDSVCLNSALAFLGVGGAWVMADRVGFRPLDFPDVIVTLTAVHFHYAGLLLPLSAGLVVRRFPAAHCARIAGLGIVLGVPGVAAGITLSRLGFSPWFELTSSGLLAASGILIAIFHVRIAFDRRHSAYGRALFFVTGCSLIFGMVLAGVYAARSLILPLPWLDIPWMRALHGSANAIGFGACGVLAWRAALRKRSTRW